MMTASEQREARLQIRMRPTERQALRELAADTGTTSSDLVREMVREAAKRHAAIAARIPTSGDELPYEAT